MADGCKVSENCGLYGQMVCRHALGIDRKEPEFWCAVSACLTSFVGF